MPQLALVRHGETELNAKRVWTGLTDVNLTEKGRQEALAAGKILANIAISTIYISELKRTYSTALGVLPFQRGRVGLINTAALNEKNYGVYTGRSKDEVLKEEGEEEFLRIRRSWDYRPEGGESLADVHARVAPLHNEIILPRLTAGENIAVISSNNTLRAYIKEIESVPPKEVGLIELGTGEVRVYDYDDFGKLVDRVIHQVGEVH